MENIRPTAVAGLFYPDNPDVLNDMLSQQLEFAPLAPKQHRPKAIIVPHAGYIYSGEVAASVYQYLKPVRQIIKRVVIIGPSHRVGFNGLALSSADSFATPLGNIPLDHNSQDKLLFINGLHMFNQAHATEHSIEVQLPFLQKLLDDFCIVPIVAGNASPKQVSQVISTLWGGAETLIIISSDLSHFHDYQTAQRLDKATSQAIIALDYEAIHSENACGCVGVNGLLKFAQVRKLIPSIIDLKNSGDTAGSKESVVGYGAYLFEEAA